MDDVFYGLLDTQLLLLTESTIAPSWSHGVKIGAGAILYIRQRHDTIIARFRFTKLRKSDGRNSI